MNTKYLVRKIGGFLLAALMVISFVAVSSTTAEAQRRGHRVIIVRQVRPYWRTDLFWYDRYGYGRFYNRYSQYVFSNSDRAQNQGYDDGLKTGGDDGKKNKSYDPERSHYFQEAGFGNFAEAYRAGFDRGYHDGYNGGYRG